MIIAEKIAGIYCILNIFDNKKYIGLSQNILRRWRTHKKSLNNNTHINEHLQSAWNKYGADNFRFQILEVVDISDGTDILKQKEVDYIEKFKSYDRRFGYNRTIGGDGIKDYDGTIRDKISKAESQNAVVQLDLAGNYIDTYRNCNFAAKAVNGSGENIRACCDKKYGRKTTKGYIWMYENEYQNKGVNLDEFKPITSAEYSGKPVAQYDLEGNFIAKYATAREAERETGIGYKLISRVCLGQRPHTHKYVFKFI